LSWNVTVGGGRGYEAGVEAAAVAFADVGNGGGRRHRPTGLYPKIVRIRCLGAESF
jgi:hypothetical protein